MVRNPGAILVPKGHSSIFGDIFGGHARGEHHLWWSHWHPVGEAKDAAKHPCIGQPHNKELRGPIVSNDPVEKSWLKESWGSIVTFTNTLIFTFKINYDFSSPLGHFLGIFLFNLSPKKMIKNSMFFIFIVNVSVGAITLSTKIYATCPFPVQTCC